MRSPREPARYLNPYVAGVLLGVILFLATVLAGHGLGASGAFGRVIAAAGERAAPAHLERHGFLVNLLGPNRQPLDHWIVWAVAGAIVGGLVSGTLSGRVRAEVARGPRLSVPMRLAAAVAGGAITGFGAQLARGCTSGQALSGGAVLSAGSWAFMFAVFAGGYALALPVRRLWR